MENGDQEATSTDQIIVSETNEQKANAHENPVNGHSEPDDSKTNGEPDKGSSEQPEDEPAKADQTEPEESTPEPDEAKPELELEASVAVLEPVVRPKEPRQSSVNGAEKEGKEEMQEGEGEEEDPNTAVYQNNKGDYDEYQSEDIEEKRKRELEIWVPGATVLQHHFHQPEPPQEESFLWLSIFTLIFFSRIFGAIALYKSIKVRLLHADKKYKEEEEASKAAKKWNIVGMIFCLCWVILVIVVLKGIGLFDESVDDY